MGPSWSVDAWIDNVGSRLGCLGIYFGYSKLPKHLTAAFSIADLDSNTLTKQIWLSSK
jgi:hypothetical protein